MQSPAQFVCARQKCSLLEQECKVGYHTFCRCMYVCTVYTHLMCVHMYIRTYICSGFKELRTYLRENVLAVDEGLHG